MQIQVNELVIDTLADGVLVMDADGIVRSANPAARHLLGAHETPYPAPFRLAAQTAWQPLAELMQRTFSQHVRAGRPYQPGPSGPATPDDCRFARA